MYDPNVGRWLSEDPIGFEDGPNPHVYIHNSPTNFTDPTGLKGDGHHIIPWHLFFYEASDEVIEIFDADDARIFNEHYNCHNSKTLNDASHYAYNKAVGEKLDKFLDGKAVKDMTPAEAKKFLKLIKSMPATSTIGKFLIGVQKEADDAYTVGKAAARAAKAAAKGASKAVKFRCSTGLGPADFFFDVIGTGVRAWANDRSFGEQVDEDVKQDPFVTPGGINPNYRPIPGFDGPSA